VPHLKGQEIDGFVEIDRKVRFKQEVQEIQDAPLGHVYYVKSNGSDSNNGKSIDKAFKTVSYAVSCCDDYDLLRVMPSHWPYTSDAQAGQYAYLERSIPINIDQMGLKIIGETTSPFLYGSPTIHAHNTAAAYSHGDITGTGSTVDTLFNIRANQVEIANLCVQMQIAAPAVYIAPTHQVNRCHIHDCAFTGYGTGTYAIRMGTATGGTGSPAMIAIENNLFNGWSAGAVELFAASGSVFRNNIVQVQDAAFGVQIKTTGLPWGLFVLDNRFIASGSTSSGLVLTNQYGTGMLLIDGNRFNGFASTAYAYTAYDAACFGLNYYNGAAITA
jgi:hypothetical protein